MEQPQTEKKEMTSEKAIGFIKEYLKETKNDEHSRYRSWIHCYHVFSEKRNELDEQTVDYLALHLAFYLASWGMYRGSSTLLKKDYKFHKSVVRIIQSKKYTPLFGISAQDLLKETNLDLLEDLRTEIQGVLDFCPTDTLVTKILLGTFGCVPAYDQYYVKSVKKYRISSRVFNRKSVCNIAKFYCDNSVEFEKLRKELFCQLGVDYPPMKLMDMCFWKAGYSE